MNMNENSVNSCGGCLLGLTLKNNNNNKLFIYKNKSYR